MWQMSVALDVKTCECKAMACTRGDRLKTFELPKSQVNCSTISFCTTMVQKPVWVHTCKAIRLLQLAIHLQQEADVITVILHAGLECSRVQPTTTHLQQQTCFVSDQRNVASKWEAIYVQGAASAHTDISRQGSQRTYIMCRNTVSHILSEKKRACKTNIAVQS